MKEGGTVDHGPLEQRPDALRPDSVQAHKPEAGTPAPTPVAMIVVAWFVYPRISSDQPREIVAPFALTGLPRPILH